MNINGTPGLGELPILKYFFASHDKVQQSDEIVFLIIPHIVRESILTDENTRAIYAGTGQTVELIRHGSEASSGAPQASNAVYTPTPNSSTTAANAASAMIPTDRRSRAAAATADSGRSNCAGAGEHSVDYGGDAAESVGGLARRRPRLVRPSR